MISPAEALHTVLTKVSPTGTEMISVFDGLERVRSNGSTSNRSLPSKDNSAMDGFAVKFADIQKIPAKLKQVGVIAAGDFTDYPELQSGECYRIMTGAFVPKGADTVVELEVTESNGDTVTVLKEKKASANIRCKGEDIDLGDPIEMIGERLNEYRQSRLISAGNLMTQVYQQVKVAVIATGDELGYPDTPDMERTVDSNSYLVKAMFEQEGASVDYLGIVDDKGEDLEQKLLNATKYDLIVTSAGISFGDFDVVTNVTDKLDIKWEFTAVTQKPGKPFSFGFLNGTPLIALPGNPVSAAFCAFMYGLPMFRKMQGLNRPNNPCVDAILMGEMKKKNDRIHFNRVKVEFKEGKFYAFPFENQNSHVIGSMAESNGYMEIPADVVGKIKNGSIFKVYLYNTDNVFS